MATSYITDFIQSLSSEEIKIVKEYVYKSNSKPVLGENKIEKLFDTLVADPEKKFTDKELSNILSSNAGALRVMKSRLLEKTKDALLSDRHFENDLIFSEREQILFDLKKKVLLAKSLYRKLNQGKTEVINLLLAEIIAKGKKYECYDVLVEALTLQRFLKGFMTGFIEFDKKTKEIQFYDHCFKSTQYANELYYKLILNNDLINTLTKKDLENHIYNSIKQLELRYKETQSQEVNYYLNLFKLYICEYIKDYKQGVIVCQKRIQLLKKSKVIYNNDRLSFALSTLGQIKIYLGKYREAIIDIKSAEKLLIKNSTNYTLLKEIEFYAYIYKGDYEHAMNCTSELMQYSLLSMGQFRQAKFMYFQSCVLFKMKKFKDALKILNKSLEIEKDKIGWNISLRVLMTMIFIELNKAGEANTSIATLRKHIERTSKGKEIKQRDILILKLLRELEKDGFKRNEKNKTATKLLVELSDKNKSTAWNYYTPELIPFHEWVVTLPEKTNLQKVNRIKT
jgi:tetratricopeptide (TPR) repeat protein